MALAREIYRALEDVVGERNISEDRGILETYRCITSQSQAHYGPYDEKTPLPQAVVDLAPHPAVVLELRRLRAIQYQHQNLDVGGGVARHAVELRAQRADGLVQTGGVGQHELAALLVDHGTDRVARGLDDGGDDRDLLADELVDEG